MTTTKMKLAAPLPFNQRHANAHGKWCRCGAPLWRVHNEHDASDMRHAFEPRHLCRACALVALSSVFVRDAEEIRQDLEYDAIDTEVHGLQDMVSQVPLGPTTQSGAREDETQRWAMTQRTRDAANQFVPHPDLWKERMGPSTKIGYRARHAFEVVVIDIETKRHLPIWTLDCGTSHHPQNERYQHRTWTRVHERRCDPRTEEDVKDSTDGDLFVSDEPYVVNARPPRPAAVP